MKTAKSILIVEDTQSIRLALIEILEMDGYEVFAYENGEEALDFLANSHAPALILLDFYMPVMNGQEFLKILRSDVSLSSIPVAVMSASADPRKLKEANYFLKKPFDIEVVLNLAKKYCS